MKNLLCVFCVLLSLISFSQVEAENLGTNVNSKYDDIKPIMSADGRVLFKLIDKHPLNTKQAEKGASQDIWYNVKDDSGRWGPSIHATEPLNTGQFNGIVWVSTDGSRILIKGYYEDGVYKHNGFSFCHKTKNGWSVPQGVIVPKFKELNKGASSSTCFTHDEKYFIISMSEVKKGIIQSLYYSALQENGTWSEPSKIHKFSDSLYTYITPFMAPDGVTLYFSSNRPGSLGSNDIWKTKRLDDTWQNWSEPVRLAEPINTKNWDAFFNLDATGEYAYMVSSFKSYGGSDIVRIKLREEDKPEPVVIVYGNVYNAKTKEPLDADLIYETLPDNKNAGVARSAETDGSYKIVLPYGKLYSFRAFADKFISVSDNLDLKSTGNFREIKRDLFLVPIEKGQVIRLNNIFFDFAKADLRPESFPELDRLVKIMENNPTMNIEMSGHTDNVGNDAANLKLSLERARSVTSYLTSKGVAAARIIPKGYGKTRPAATNDTEEGRQLNRRVEFTIQ